MFNVFLGLEKHMPKIGMQSIRKQQLIQATLAVINEVGMQDASIALIARKAGVSNGIISHYFRDKKWFIGSGNAPYPISVRFCRRNAITYF